MIDVERMIERWCDGDDRAAEALYNHFRERTFYLAYGLLGDAADAEEAAQDALTYALLNIRRYDPERASFATWLHTIAVSHCRDHYRRQRRPRLSLERWLGRGHDPHDPSPGPERRVMAGEVKSEVWQAVHELKPILREAIVLRYWLGHTYREMAEILDCPLRTAQSRVRLAFQELQARLTAAELGEASGFEEVM
jgi:RNA polymerase sigma-70 factor (ECF subfamily)